MTAPPLATSTAIPFEFIRPEIPLVAFEASLDGGSNARFVLDSGNSKGLILSESYARERNLDLKAKKMPKDSFMVGSTEEPTAFATRIDSLRIGDFELRVGAVSVSNFVDYLNQAIGADAAGNIGYAILKKYAVTLDYPGMTLTLDRKPAKPKNGIPFTLGKEPLILVEAGIDGKGPFTMVIDTGASASVISAGLAKSIPLSLGERMDVMGAAGIIDGWPTRAEIDLGEGCRAELDVIVADFFDGLSAATGAEIHGVIGYDFLKPHRVTIDYPHRVLVLDAGQ